MEVLKFSSCTSVDYFIYPWAVHSSYLEIIGKIKCEKIERENGK
jgi:hypothetical protein